MRAHAGLALAARNAIEKQELLGQLGHAEEKLELPLLAAALSYFDAAAVQPLEKALQDTFTSYDDEFHEFFATALGRMTLEAAKASRTKWYKRH